MTTDNLELTLDLDDINKQIEKESRCPAQLVRSEYTVSVYDGVEKKQWVLEWERLDRATNFPLRSYHSMPDPSQDIAGRRRRSYYKQVQAFASIDIRGSKPEDFLGTKAWIIETVEGAGSRFEKTWWKPVKKYVEGEPFESDSNNIVAVAAADLAIPTASADVADDSVMEKLLILMNGKSHRQVLIAVNSDPVLSRNTDITSGLESGALVQELKDGGYLTEENGKYKRIG